MSSRNKRLKKGIVSIEEQIAKHKKKLADARSNGDDGLCNYYEKEIRGMEEQVKKRKDILDK